jgi:molecular chaperone HtpG
METHAFQAEVQKLLELMVHSIYSNKDIFLRELISNASDALDKLRYEQLTREELRSDRALEIGLEVDRAARTITIRDDGIGMTRDEVVKNLGTIARSGTEELKKQLADTKAAGAPELIGQFGVGFYSSFMVAEDVTVVTRRAGEVGATEWRSRGDGRFSVGDATRPTHGTTITLKLKPVDEEASLHDYTAEHVLREIVRRYSDFVSYPIKLEVWREDKDTKVPVRDTVTLNSMKAIWTKPRSEVTEQELADFYRHVSHDWQPPLRSISVKIEGTFEASALLFIPSKAPFDLYQPEMRRGIHLYVKRVFILDDARELMPSWLRFVRGVVDAQDLPLNVSREILQKSRQVQAIRKQLVRRVLDALVELQKEAPADYARAWAQFGPVLKEGLVGDDAVDREKLLSLLMLSSTHGAEASTLDAYVERMKPEQEAIYVLTGPSPEAVRSSPLLEAFKDKGYEVLLLSDGIDEVWLEREPTYKGKALKSIGRGDVELGSEEERKQAKEALESRASELRGLLGALRVALQDDVKEVRLTQRLTRSPACLVLDEGDLSPQLERLMAAMGQAVPKTKRILELNGEHPLVRRMEAMQNDPTQAPRVHTYAQLLYGQALLGEGQSLADPAAFAQQVVDLMLTATSDAPAPAA